MEDKLIYIKVTAGNGYMGCINEELYIFTANGISDEKLREICAEEATRAGEDYEYVAYFNDIEDEEERQAAIEDYYENCYAEYEYLTREEAVEEFSEEWIRDEEAFYKIYSAS